MDIVAVDHSGTYCIRKLKTTGRGSVVQVLDPASDAGNHRTWHPTGYVHDRTTNPPSTTSMGHITPPTAAICECWAREDLKSGELARFQLYDKSADTFLIDLRVGSRMRRFEAWYVSPEHLQHLLDSLHAQAAPGTLQLRQDRVLGRIRLLAAFELRDARRITKR